MHNKYFKHGGSKNMKNTQRNLEIMSASAAALSFASQWRQQFAP
jgi:hypothetical protein